MTEPNDKTGGIDFAAILRVLRARRAVIVICAVVTTGVALALSLSQQKLYSASSSLLFRTTNLDQTVFGSTFYQQEDPTQNAATNAVLVSLPVVDGRTAASIGGGLTEGTVRDEIKIAQQGQSNVVQITATDPSPQRAARIATVFAQQYVLFRQDADRAKVHDATVLVQHQVDGLTPEQKNTNQGRSLISRLQQLQVLAALQTGNAEVVQTANAPTSPSSPDPKRDAGIGLLLGLLLGVGLAFALERVDRRFKDPQQISETFDRPILGAIPESRTIKNTPYDPARLGAGEAEAFRMLRANLRYFNVDREIRSILITSSAPGDGKSTVATHLASTAASVGDKVLLIEADLRHPVIARRLQLVADRGLSQVLASQSASLDDVKYRVPVARSPKRDVAFRYMDVVVAGPLPPNPSDLIESAKLKHVLEEAEREYDLVIVDTPPASVVSDAIPLVNHVSGVMVVCRIGKTTRDAASHLSHQLAHLNANTLGVVVNSVGKETGRYGYGYGYGYSYDYAPASESVEAIADSSPLPEASLVVGNGHGSNAVGANGTTRRDRPDLSRRESEAVPRDAPPSGAPEPETTTPTRGYPSQAGHPAGSSGPRNHILGKRNRNPDTSS